MGNSNFHAPQQICSNQRSCGPGNTGLIPKSESIQVCVQAIAPTLKAKLLTKGHVCD